MSKDALSFAGKIVLVTGGGRGIGRGIASGFLDAGATVYICGRSQPKDLVQSSKRSAIFLAADVREPDQVGAMIDEIVKKQQRLDVLVNNAGGAPFAKAKSASPRFSEKIVQLNLLGALHCAQRANHFMQDQAEGGSIINIASVSGTRPSPGTAAYGAAKAGLINLTASLAIEWAPKVRVNAVSAGMIATEQSQLHYGDSASMTRIAQTIPLQRFGTPQDIAHACLFLASPLASYISGANLLVHGGGETPAFLSALGAANKS